MLQAENDELNNEVLHLRNAEGTHLTPQGGSILDSVFKGSAPKGMPSAGGGKSDARLVLDEICEILSVPGADPVVLLDTIRKLERVVKAVPRMEGFIQNLSLVLGEGYGDAIKPLPLEQIIPRLNLWKQIVMHS